jgi:hypothetical protein
MAIHIPGRQIAQRDWRLAGLAPYRIDISHMVAAALPLAWWLSLVRSFVRS